VFPIKSNVVETINIFGLKVSRIKVDKTLGLALTPLMLLPSIALLVPIAVMRRSVVFDRAVFTPEEVATLTGYVYVPIRCKIGKVLPSGITFVQPDEDLARDIHEIYDVPIRSAEAIAIALQYGATVYLSDVKAVKVAISLGVEAIYAPLNRQTNVPKS
jgi:hypothetical protein